MIRFLHVGLVYAAAAGLFACAPAPAPPPLHAAAAPAPSDQLTRLVDGYWDEYLKLNPQRPPVRVAVRVDPAAGYDISAQSLADSLALERRYLQTLLAVPREGLSAASQLTYDLFKRERELAIESFTYPFELLPVNPSRSMPLEFARMGAGADQYAVLSAKDYDNWQARADAYVRWTAAAIANMREGMRRGYTLPRVLVEETLPVLQALSEDTSASVFYLPLRSIPGTTSESERKRIADGITAGVKDRILPAYRTLHDFLLNVYLPRARDSTSLSLLPLGEAWYAFLIRRETASRLTAAEIHALGLAEIERLHARQQTVLAEAGFAGNAQAFFEAARHDPRVTFKTPEEALSFYDQLKVEAAAAIPKSFAPLSQADFAIRPVEVHSQANAPALAYQRAPNRSSPAVLYVNLRVAGEPLVPQTAAFLREALPGHHYQIAMQDERADLPRFRRSGGDPGFVAGWGLYAESLGEELGLYRDTESKFAAVSDQLECSAGLVVDTGLHALGWSRAQALDYLRTQVPMDEASAASAVDRDLSLPGEALACGLGARTIRALRAHAEQVLGSRFEALDFHAQLLAGGALPLDILESRFNLWLNGPH